VLKPKFQEARLNFESSIINQINQIITTYNTMANGGQLNNMLKS